MCVVFRRVWQQVSKYYITPQMAGCITVSNMTSNLHNLFSSSTRAEAVHRQKWKSHTIVGIPLDQTTSFMCVMCNWIQFSQSVSEQESSQVSRSCASPNSCFRTAPIKNTTEGFLKVRADQLEVWGSTKGNWSALQVRVPAETDGFKTDLGLKTDAVVNGLFTMRRWHTTTILPGLYKHTHSSMTSQGHA